MREVQRARGRHASRFYNIINSADGEGTLGHFREGERFATDDRLRRLDRSQYRIAPLAGREIFAPRLFFRLDVEPCGLR